MPNFCATNAESTKPYDVAIIGAGSAGFSAAIAATEEGANVVLIGQGTIGGTCVNTGCVPSKTMIRAADALYGARTVGRFAGLMGEAHVADWGRLIAAKDELVTTLRQKKYIDLLSEYEGISYREGVARLTETGVALNGTAISASKVIITTGARPALPDIAGIESVPYLTSTTAFELLTLPRSLLVIGAGYIGCELAQMFARVGVEVTIVSRRGLLPEAEPEVAEALAGFFTDEGIRVASGSTYRHIELAGKEIALTIDRNGRSDRLSAERVLIATGRTPNTEGLGLQEAGVAQHSTGAIRVDQRMRTTRLGVYAAGDVTGRDQFVYMAAYGAKLAAWNALNDDGLHYDNAAVPAVVFTDPQVSSVGLTEMQARQAGHAVKTTVLSLENVPRALAARDTRGLIKLVADVQTDRLLGAHILAPEGADSIQTAVLAIRYGMTVRDLAATIFPYLTTVEGLKLAAQTFEKDLAKLSCCAI
ncbi:MAG: mercury(II) reductase [Alphaproteobacteria bacterium]